MIDGLFINKLTINLKNKLLKGKIQKIYQLNDNEILFKVRANRKNFQIINSINANSFRLHITYKEYQTSATPTNLTMLLRKHLEGGVIEDIYQFELDRIIIFNICKHNDLSNSSSSYLIFELLGRHSNTILCDDKYRIIQTLKYIPINKCVDRMIHKGATYEFIQSSTKINPLDLLLKTDSYFNYQGFSKSLNEQFILYQNNGYDIKVIFDKYMNNSTVYVSNNNFSYLEFLNEDNITFQDVNSALDYLFYNLSTKDNLSKNYKNTIKKLNSTYKKNTKKIDKLNIQYITNNKTLNIKKFGTLLYDNIYLFNKNEHFKEVEVFDYEANMYVNIPLDDKISISQNAAQYMKKYRKAKYSFIYLKEQIEIATKENCLISYYLDLFSFADVDDASEIMYELEKSGLLKSNHSKLKIKKNYLPKYDCYLSTNDTKIYVGKNRIQNEYITHTLASKEDIWLHVKDYSGSHVVIKDDCPDDKTLLEAANLALYYSKARNLTKVVIDYTPIKNIKKSKGSLTGAVSFRVNKSIIIDQDISILNSLRKVK